MENNTDIFSIMTSSAMEQTTANRLFKWNSQLRDPLAKQLQMDIQKALDAYKNNNYDLAITLFTNCKEKAQELKQNIEKVREPTTHAEQRQEVIEMMGQTAATLLGWMITLPISAPIGMIYGLSILLKEHIKYDGKFDLREVGDWQGDILTRYNDPMAQNSTNSAKQNAHYVVNRFIHYCDVYIKMCNKAQGVIESDIFSVFSSGAVESVTSIPTLLNASTPNKFRTCKDMIKAGKDQGAIISAGMHVMITDVMPSNFDPDAFLKNINCFDDYVAKYYFDTYQEYDFMPPKDIEDAASCLTITEAVFTPEYDEVSITYTINAHSDTYPDGYVVIHGFISFDDYNRRRYNNIEFEYATGYD